ncbi:hypothetical protein ACNQFZ_20000 [Schinkia sp. CFF1]
MGFWKNIGLASYQDIKRIEGNQAEITTMITKLQQDHTNAVTKMRNDISLEMKSLISTLSKQMDEQNNRIDEQMTVLRQEQAYSQKKYKTSQTKLEKLINQSQTNIETRMGIIEEIVKIHWANELLEHVDIILNEIESEPSKQSDVSSNGNSLVSLRKSNK